MTHAADTQVTRTTPADRPWMRILTTVVLALGVGFAMFVAAGLIALGTDLTLGAVCVWTGVAIIATLALGLLRRDLFDILYIFEETTNIDLNRDGTIGQPAAITVIEAQFEIHVDGSRLYADLRCPSLDVLYDWAFAAMSGGSTAYATWGDAWALSPDGKDGEKNYREFRSILVARRLAKEKGTHGIDLTPLGLMCFATWLAQGTEPTPPPHLAPAEPPKLTAGEPAHTGTPEMEG